MSYVSDHLAWQQRVSQEDKASKRFQIQLTNNSFSNPTDEFYKFWTKKNFNTTNKYIQDKMLRKMHPSIQRKFVNNFDGEMMAVNRSMKPANKSMFFHNLQKPVKPKPRPFFQQAY